ncbi:hypothetical protein LTS18_010273 [Coniosporium uncinatum]|uniref:Uncharacterized protein n=1 Tax=Coniosporium uncinatum TaxID=93489 RepID=A0ACC3DLS3_9PEZI|nr:hypothetical protein LTS18_010273 [Coniosporium uncinatum]
MPSEDLRRLQTMETLVWLRVGDIASAQHCLDSATSSTDANDQEGKLLEGLIAIANGEYQDAVAKMQALHEQHPDDALVTQNLAVCLVYTGQLPESQALLEKLVDGEGVSRSVTFNLATLYELSTERARDLKGELAGKMARREPERGEGRVWEKSGADFKL